MFYPIAIPSLMQGALIGANGTDPTIPYSPDWTRRLGSALWSIARRNQRQSRPPRGESRRNVTGRAVHTPVIPPGWHPPV